MTLDDAVGLARGVVACDSRILIVAIGRFLPIDQIKPDSPWMISIQESGAERPRILRQSSDVSQFQPKQTPVTPLATKAARSAEPMLF